MRSPLGITRPSAQSSFANSHGHTNRRRPGSTLERGVNVAGAARKALQSTGAASGNGSRGKYAQACGLPESSSHGGDGKRAVKSSGGNPVVVPEGCRVSVQKIDLVRAQQCVQMTVAVQDSRCFWRVIKKRLRMWPRARARGEQFVVQVQVRSGPLPKGGS